MLVRRAICGLTPKNYNNVFLQLYFGRSASNTSQIVCWVSSG